MQRVDTASTPIQTPQKIRIFGTTVFDFRTVYRQIFMLGVWYRALLPVKLFLFFSISCSAFCAMKRGAFILFEGVDRCGKSTQSAMLAKYLAESQRQSELIRFPERSTTIGNLIDQYLKSASNLNDQSIHLLFSANRWESSASIEGSLNSGVNLVRIHLILCIL